MSEHDRRDTARKVEIVTSSAAGSVGAALGGAKLRDAYAEEHAHSFAAGERRVARALGPRPARFLAHAKPGFKPLAAGTATAITATAASKYRQKKDHEAARRLTARPITKPKREPVSMRLTFKRDGDEVLDNVDRVDVVARAVKDKVVPSKPVIARKISAASAKLKEQVQQDLNKAYDPKRTRRRRARAVEIGSGAAAVGVSASGVHARRTAGKHWTAAANNEQAAGRAFRAAHESNTTVDAHVVGYHENMKRGFGHGRARTATNYANTITEHGRGTAHMSRGMVGYRAAYIEGATGHRLAARSVKHGLAGAGLAAVAVGAEHVARRNRH